MKKKLKLDKLEFNFMKNGDVFVVRGIDICRFLDYTRNTVIYDHTEEEDRVVEDNYVWLNGKALQDLLDKATKVRDDQRCFINRYIKPELNETTEYKFNRQMERLKKEAESIRLRLEEIEEEKEQIRRVREWI